MQLRLKYYLKVAPSRLVQSWEREQEIIEIYQHCWGLFLDYFISSPHLGLTILSIKGTAGSLFGKWIVRHFGDLTKQLLYLPGLHNFNRQKITRREKNPFPVLFVQLETELLVLGDVRAAPLSHPSPRQCGPTSIVHKTRLDNSANFEADHCLQSVWGATDRTMLIHQPGWGLQSLEMRTPTSKEWRREVGWARGQSLKPEETGGKCGLGNFFSSLKISEKYRIFQLRPCEGLFYIFISLY